MHFSCWLNLELIWSFFGPACVIIIVSKIISKRIIIKMKNILKTDFSAFLKPRTCCLSDKHLLFSHHCVEVGTEVLKFKP